MLRIVLLFSAACFTLPAGAVDTKPVARDDFKTAPLDDRFLAAAAECANCQCNLAELAGKRSARKDVKEFAAKLERDHKALMKDVLRDVKTRKLAIVVGTSKEDKAACAEVGKLEGKAFDDRFLDEIIARHEKAIRMCENQIKNGKDKDVTAVAQSAVKTLREHLDLARRLKA